MQRVTASGVGHLRSVTVFDVGLAPALAFIRSLARCGVPVVACSDRRVPAGRFSRYVRRLRRAPVVHDSETFISWLVGEIESNRIELVAPTSDYVVFCVAEAMDRLGRSAHDAGLPPTDGIRNCLFKGRFADALATVGFPSPPAAIPQSLGEALDVAQAIGYPVLLKPRSHVGIGAHRGVVVADRHELARAYRPYEIGAAHHAALRHVPGLSQPMLQRYFEPGAVEVISVSGCLDVDGSVLALTSARKLAQSPPRFGVGTRFEPIEPMPFIDEAVRAVRAIVGSGLFEFEVLVEPDGSYYAIDLNPRGFGQMTLDLALGRDLPRLWYSSVTGHPLPSEPARIPVPAYWQDALPSYVALGVALIREPGRYHAVREAVRWACAPKVGAAFDARDPLPGLVAGAAHLRHPRAFLRRFAAKVETADHHHRASAPRSP